MENLPTPLSRVELYLAKACGMDVTVPEAPQDRLEQYLAIIAGDTTIEMPTPHSLTEQWLAYILGVEPSPLLEVVGAHYIDNQKVDTRYLAVAAGMPGAVAPARPQNRKEQYWAILAEILPVHGVLKYATGTNIYLTDVVSGIEELQFVYGDTFQQTYSGKNLFNVDGSSGVYQATKTISGQSLTATATANGVGYVSVVLPNSGTLLGKSCTISFSAQASVGDARIRIMSCLSSSPDVVGSLIAYKDGNGEQTLSFTFPDSFDSGKDAFAVLFYIQSTSSITIGDSATYSNIQLEIGSTATPWEKFVGGTASPNPDYPQDIDVVTGEQTVKVTGKNKLPPTADFQETLDDVPINYSNGVFNINGTASGSGGYNATWRSVTPQYTIQNGDYWHYNNTFTSYNMLIQIRFTDNSAVALDTISAVNKIVDLSSYAGKTLKEMRINLRGGYSYVGTISPMIVNSSSPTTYEPYQSTTKTVNLTSKNLFDKTATPIFYDQSTVTQITNGVRVTSTGTGSLRFARYLLFSTKDYVGKTLTLSANMQASASNTPRINLGLCDSSGNNRTIKFNLNSSGSASYLVEDDPDRQYLFLNMYCNTSGTLQVGDYVDYTNIQLEVGSTPTPYTDYFTPIELCKIGTYQDYIYKSGDDWYVHKAITKTILDGAEDWSGHNTYNGIKGFYWLNAGAAHSNSAIIANSYRGVPITTYNSDNRTFGMLATLESGTTLTTYTIFATQPNASTSSLAQFKTWLSSNNITTYYAAETPTDTKITDSTLIGQLNAVDSAVLPKPVAYIDISASGTNLPASIKISYYGEEE